MTIKGLIKLIAEGKVDPKDLTIYFDGGDFFITLEGSGEICSGNPEQALADALGIEIGIV